MLNRMWLLHFVQVLVCAHGLSHCNALHQGCVADGGAGLLAPWTGRACLQASRPLSLLLYACHLRLLHGHLPTCPAPPQGPLPPP